jgi:hypothetical protein
MLSPEKCFSRIPRLTKELKSHGLFDPLRRCHTTGSRAAYSYLLYIISLTDACSLTQASEVQVIVNALVYSGTPYTGQTNQSRPERNPEYT